MIWRRRSWFGRGSSRNSTRLRSSAWNCDGRCGDDHRAAIGRKFLPYVPQPAHHDRIVHVTVKVFQDKCSLDRHRLQIAERLGWFLAVVERLCASLIMAQGSSGKAYLRDRFSHVAAAARQSAGDAPLESSQIQRRAGCPHQTHRPHLFHGFHHDNGGGRIEQDFQALQGIWHKGLTVYGLTIKDLLP